MSSYIKQFCAGLSLAAICTLSAVAQPSFTPAKLGAAINTDYPELNPVLSANGDELFFVRANHPQNTYGENDSQDIWYSKRGADGQWSEAVRVDALNIGRYNAIWSLMPDGKSAMIHGRYNKKGNIWKGRGFSMVSRGMDGNWGTPTPIKVSRFNKINRGLYTTAYLTPDGEHLLTSFSKSYNGKKSNLYVSTKKKNGNFGKPKKIKIRQNGQRQTPFVSADGKKLYFASDVAGNLEVLVAERQDDTWRKWSVPVPAIKQVSNEVDSEYYLKTNTSGSIAWFARKPLAGTPDIHYVKLYEENPFIVVSGRILDQNTQNPITAISELQMLANGNPDSSLVINTDGTYSLKLPLGKNYELQPKLKYHTSSTATIKADSLIEFTQSVKDLYLTPWKVVQVKGKMLQRNAKSMIPAEAAPQIMLNGQTPDSIIVDLPRGEYTMWVPYGKNHTVQVLAKEYKAEAQTLELSKVTAYKELVMDLYADKTQTATVQGKLIDSKTGNRFPAGIPVQVVLNDTLQLMVADSLGTYEVNLPVGTSYSLSAKAEGYYPLTEMIDLQQETQSIKIFKDLYLAPVEVGQSIRLNNVFFDNGKSILKPASYPELDRVVEFLKENAGMKVEIAGHTDNKGSAALNNKLSAARASAVQKYILSKGISAESLSSKGYGSTKPEADNKTEEGRSKNRRVEFTILKIVE